MEATGKFFCQHLLLLGIRESQMATTTYATFGQPADGHALFVPAKLFIEFQQFRINEGNNVLLADFSFRNLGVEFLPLFADNRLQTLLFRPRSLQLDLDGAYFGLERLASIEQFDDFVFHAAFTASKRLDFAAHIVGIAGAQPSGKKTLLFLVDFLFKQFELTLGFVFLKADLFELFGDLIEAGAYLHAVGVRSAEQFQLGKRLTLMKKPVYLQIDGLQIQQVRQTLEFIHQLPPRRWGM